MSFPTLFFLLLCSQNLVLTWLPYVKGLEGCRETSRPPVSPDIWIPAEPQLLLCLAARGQIRLVGLFAALHFFFHLPQLTVLSSASYHTREEEVVESVALHCVRGRPLVDKLDHLFNHTYLPTDLHTLPILAVLVKLKCVS